MTRLYTASDVDITLTIGTGFVIADVVTFTFQLVKTDGTATVTLTSVGGSVVVGATTIIVSIPDSAITTAGVYTIRCSFTDSEGSIRACEPSTAYLTFY